MVDFVLATPSAKQVWSEDVAREYVRASGFLPYMQSKGGILNVQNELMGSAGNVIHVPAYAKLRGGVVRGSATLVGNEGAQVNYSMPVVTDIVRAGTTVRLSEQFKTEIDVLNEGRYALKNQLAETLRDDIIAALQSVPVVGSGTGTNPEDGVVSYAAATAAQQNNWLVKNNDRVLYGSKKSNTTAGNHATSMATLAGALTTNKLSAGTILLARKMARTTTNSSTFAITPYKTKTGQEWYVLFVDSNGFRDLKVDPIIYAANKDARPRERDMDENPIFSGTNTLMYDGVLIVEVPELPTVQTNVGYAHLCGLQAVNIGYSMKPVVKTRAEDDYGMIKGVAMQEIRGQQKASVGQTQIGMLSLFHPSVDDA